jgi:hypothetical protein
MKFNNLLYDLILEASKKDILIQKIGLSERNAEFLSNLCGPLSVFIANKLIDEIPSHLLRAGQKETLISRQEALDYINQSSVLRLFNQKIVSIMDWIRVGLNGNAKPYVNLSFEELFNESKKWHDELQVGDSTIDYKEEHPVVVDFRNEKGYGYYWVDLETKDCDEESKRMGHCGRSAGNLYSLRLTSPIENTKFSKNKSLVTASVNDSGVLLQMKGPHNKKPSEELHPYIVPFILNDIVREFGSEYQSSEDFSLTDLPEDKIKEVYDQKPDLFDNRKGKKALRKIGLLSDRSTEDMMFELQIDAAYISRYVDGDWTVRKYKDSNGRQREIGMFETLLSGDYWDLFDNGGHWDTALEFYIDDDNKQIIWDLIRGFANEEEIGEMSLEEAIKSFDNNYEIRNALGNAMSSAESDSYYVYYRNTLQNALEEYGTVTKLNDEGATIEINLKTVIDNHGVNEDDLDDYFERCDDSYECVFDELMGDYYDKPDFRIDDRWTPDVDERYFNEVLNDYLGDVRM